MEKSQAHVDKRSGDTQEPITPFALCSAMPSYPPHTNVASGLSAEVSDDRLGLSSLNFASVFLGRCHFHVLQHGILGW